MAALGGIARVANQFSPAVSIPTKQKWAGKSSSTW
jgi:hypothetical protein